MLPRLARSCADEDGPLWLLRPGAGGDRAMMKPEEEIARMAAQIVKLSLTQDRMVQDLAVHRGGSLQAVRNYYGIGERA